MREQYLPGDRPGQYLTIPARGRLNSGPDNSVLELFILERDNSNDVKDDIIESEIAFYNSDSSHKHTARYL